MFKPLIPYGPVRLLGTYPQRQEGLFMQRIPFLGGRITPRQLRRVVELAEEFTGETPLHITTRQDIELHNIAETNVAEVQAALAEIGISTYGACGDFVRNITVCPCCGLDPAAVEMTPLAEQVRDAVLSAAGALDLPRKFKISFTGCGGTGARPYLQDLGFVARSPESIRVIGAGSLGPRPQPGIVLYDSIRPGEAVPLVFAALEVFAEHGDRENRRTARLRHVRQRMGDETFRVLLDGAFQRHKNAASHAPVRLSLGQSGFDHRLTLQTLGGDISCKQAQDIANLADGQAIQIRINLWHGIDLYSRVPFSLPPSLHPLTHRPRIVACPGNSTCTRGLANCRAAAEAMAEALAQSKKNDVTVGISGCPNNCALSVVCDIGLVGRVKTMDGVRQEAFDIYTGGNGGDERLAQRKDTVAAADLKNYFARS